MDPDWLEAARESAAEHADQFGYRELEECAVAARLELCRQIAAEKGLDLRPPQRLELIRGGRRTIGMCKYARISFELLRAVERHKEFVVEPQRQTLRRVGFLWQRRRELNLLLRQQRAGDGHDDLIGRDRAARRLDPQSLAAVVDAVHRTIEHRRQFCAGRGDDRA